MFLTWNIFRKKRLQVNAKFRSRVKTLAVLQKEFKVLPHVQKNDFYLSVESNLRLLWFFITTLNDWLKKLAPLTQPIRNKTKPIVTCSRKFSRASCNCFEFDWTMDCSASFVTGQSNYFGLGFTTLNWKLFCKKDILFLTYFKTAMLKYSLGTYSLSIKTEIITVAWNRSKRTLSKYKNSTVLVVWFIVFEVVSKYFPKMSPIASRTWDGGRGRLMQWMKRVCRISLPSSYRNALKTEVNNKIMNKQHSFIGYYRCKALSISL